MAVAWLTKRRSVDLEGETFWSSLTYSDHAVHARPYMILYFFCHSTRFILHFFFFFCCIESTFEISAGAAAAESYIAPSMENRQQANWKPPSTLLSFISVFFFTSYDAEPRHMWPTLYPLFIYFLLLWSCTTAAVFFRIIFWWLPGFGSRSTVSCCRCDQPKISTDNDTYIYGTRF